MVLMEFLIDRLFTNFGKVWWATSGAAGFGWLYKVGMTVTDVRLRR